MRVGRHLVEFDGKQKYPRRDRGGLAVVDPDQVVWQEKQREDWLRGYRLGMSRLVWDDFWGHAASRAKERVRREYDATCAAYGTDICDLAHCSSSLGLTLRRLSRRSATCNAVFDGTYARVLTRA